MANETKKTGTEAKPVQNDASNKFKDGLSIAVANRYNDVKKVYENTANPLERLEAKARLEELVAVLNFIREN